MEERNISERELKDANGLIATNQEKPDIQKKDEHILLEKLLEKAGGCGRFQIFLEIVICLMTYGLAFQPLLMYFVGHSPEWRCSRGGNVAKSKECFISGTVHSSNTTQYNLRCQMDRHSWEYVTERDYSFITELDLVCNTSAYGTLANSGFYIGWGIGALPMGILSDFLGRKPVFFASYLTVMVSSIGLAFSTSFSQFFSLRIISGIGQSGFSLTSYVLASENVAPKYRAATGNILFIVMVLSFVSLDFLAYFVRKWRILVLLSSAPFLGLVFFYCYVPESLRWLLAKKNVDKTRSVLQRIARINRQPDCNFGLSLPSVASKKRNTKGSVIDIIRHRVLLTRSLNQGFSWFVCGMTYYGISLASVDLTGSFYRDFALTCIVEVPSIFLLIYGVERFGRKKVVSYSLCLAGVLCTTIAFLPQKSINPVFPLLRVSCGMLGKFFNSIAFNGFYVWSIELYPTVIRTQGLSFVFFMARVGASSAPFVTNQLKLIHPGIPFILMGACSVLSGMLSMFLPETKGMPMPETLQDCLQGPKYNLPIAEEYLLKPIGNAEENAYNTDGAEDENSYNEESTLL